ncbi:CAP domain-containing protein [Robertkochia solimangrovi]|uniref:CAP domain-containing protein n=1 Tax=Robertkochia solimangrovi TaxID=2213046 RepID=UPI00117FCC40|nr:CAP domain-containing protein [Robertkochia solimangrovi]TRZ42879.1 CAP domain-containing protein [Robertkochia solimangrovi]
MKTFAIKDRSLICILFLSILTLISCTTEDISENMPTKDSDGDVVASLQSDIVSLLNAHREEVGLEPLKVLDVAYLKAEEHTNYMISVGKVNHDFFFQREAYLVDNAGAAEVAENVAYAYSTAEGVVNAWLKSESHRINIEGDYTHMTVCAMKNKDGKVYYTNIFVKI